jgi:exopolysaccharide biosynthesis polyprenyl glycosylphosphotransferase
MKRSESLLMVLQVPVDFFLLVLAGISAYNLRFTEWAVDLKPVLFELALADFVSIVSLVAVSWIVLFALLGLYKPDPNRKLGHDLTRVLYACSTGLAFVAVYVMFTQQQFDSRFIVATTWVLAILYVAIGRISMRGLKAVMYRAGYGLRRVVIIGNDVVAETIIAALKDRPELGYKVVKVFSRFDEKAEATLKRGHVDEVIFANPRAHEKEALRAIDVCAKKHITFKYSADVFATYSSNMVIHPVAGVPVVELKRTSIGAWGKILKRAFDIVLSLFVLVITSPITALSALIILIESGRPIIYKNERVGLRGENFFTLKFRSMHKKFSTGKQFGKSGEEAMKKEQELIEKQNSRKGPIYKIADDPRVTAFGKFIRRWSVDELPQFFNVLGGSMSIVGPRPHQPREVKKYKDDYPLVFDIKPGITGLAQISGRSDLSFEDEMKLDVLYIERWNLWIDFIIFIKTPFILLKRRKVV